MPYVFVDDGYPEAGEFEDNYIWVGRASAPAPKPGRTDYFSPLPRLMSSAADAARMASAKNNSSTTP